MENITHTYNTYCTRPVVKTQADYALILQPQAALFKCWKEVGTRELLYWLSLQWLWDFIFSDRGQELVSAYRICHHIWIC